MRDINEVAVRGFIVNKYIPPQNENMVIVTVNVPAKKSEIPNYPKVVFFGAEAQEAKKFDIYANVEIKASIQTQRKIINGEKTYYQSIIGKSIKESDRTLSNAFAGDLGGAYLAPENIVKMKGTIRQARLLADNVLALTIETYIDSRHSFVSCFVYGPKAKTYVAQFPIGTEVAALGEIQTLKKVKDDQTNHYMNVVIKEIKAV